MGNCRAFSNMLLGNYHLFTMKFADFKIVTNILCLSEGTEKVTKTINLPGAATHIILNNRQSRVVIIL